MRKILVALTISLAPGLVWADSSLDQESDALDRMVNSIHSVAQVKKEIRENLRSSDECTNGGCFDNTWTTICSVVGALDIKVDNKMLDEHTHDKISQPFPVSDTDIAMMRLIAKNCRPSSDYSWNYGTPFHVIYSPESLAVDNKIRKYVGLKPNS